MKKLLFILFILINTLIAQYSGGTGTKVDPYIITTPTQFVSAISTSDAQYYFALGNDIDMQSVTMPNTRFLPRGLTAANEAGRYIIRNISITVTDYTGSNVSVFTTPFNPDQGVFENIIFKDITLTGTLNTNANIFLASFIGEMSGAAIFDFSFNNVVVDKINIFFEESLGSVNAPNNVFMAGFLARRVSNNFKIINCVVRNADIQYEGNIRATDEFKTMRIAGFIADGGGGVTITGSWVDSLNISNIAPNRIGAYPIDRLYVGGFSAARLDFHDCYARGTIDVDDVDFKVGGFIVGNVSTGYAVYSDVNTTGCLADVYGFGYDVGADLTGTIFVNEDITKSGAPIYQSSGTPTRDPLYKTTEEMQDINQYLDDPAPLGRKFNFTNDTLDYVWTFIEGENDDFPVMLNNLYTFTIPVGNKADWVKIEWIKADTVYFTFLPDSNEVTVWPIDSVMIPTDALKLYFNSTTETGEISGVGVGPLTPKTIGPSPLTVDVPDVTSPFSDIAPVVINLTPYLPAWQIGTTTSSMSYNVKGNKTKYINLTRFEAAPDSLHQDQFLFETLSRQVEQFELQYKITATLPKKASYDSASIFFQEVLFVSLVDTFFAPLDSMKVGDGTTLDNIDIPYFLSYYTDIVIPDLIVSRYDSILITGIATEVPPKGQGNWIPNFEFIKEFDATPRKTCMYTSNKDSRMKWIEDLACGSSPGYRSSTKGATYGLYKYSTLNKGKTDEVFLEDDPSYYDFNIPPPDVSAWEQYLIDYEDIGGNPTVPNPSSGFDWLGPINIAEGDLFHFLSNQWYLSFLDGEASIYLYFAETNPTKLYGAVVFEDEVNGDTTKVTGLVVDDQIDQSLIFGGFKPTAQNSPATYCVINRPTGIVNALGYNIGFFDPPPAQYLHFTKPREYYQRESSSVSVGTLKAVKIQKDIRDYFRGIHPKIFKYGNKDGIKP